MYKHEKASKQELEFSLIALVETLMIFISDFEEVYEAVSTSELYRVFSRWEVLKCYKDIQRRKS